MEQARLSIAEPEALFTTRLLGTLGIIGSPLLLAAFLSDMTLADSPHKVFVGSFLQFFYVFSWICSVIGMRRLRATGTGTGSQIAFIIQMIGLILAATLNLKELTQTQPDDTSLFFHVTDVGYPFSHLFMIVAGIMIIRAKVWHGWGKVGALTCGLALPLTMKLGAVINFNIAIILFGILTAAGLVLFGNAVRTGDEAKASF